MSFLQLRRSKFLTQKELADKSGVSLPTVKRIEGGGYFPGLRVTRLLAEALDVEPKDLEAAILQQQRAA